MLVRHTFWKHVALCFIKMCSTKMAHSVSLSITLRSCDEIPPPVGGIQQIASYEPTAEQ